MKNTNPQANDIEFNFSIVIPAYNEEKTVGAILSKFKSLYPAAEIILVNNRSNDRTKEEALKVPGVIVVDEMTPGKGAAMRKGIELASREYLLFHDADLEYLPEDCLELMKIQTENSEALISGSRQFNIASLPWASVVATNLIRKILEFRFLPLRGVDVLTGTRSGATHIWKKLNLKTHDFSIETEIVRNACRTSVPLVPIPISYMPRSYQEGKKIKATDIFKLLRVALS